MQQCDHPYSQAMGLSLCVYSKSITKNMSVLKFALLLLQPLPLNPSKPLLCKSYLNMLQYCVNHVISLIYTCVMTVVKMLSENTPTVCLSE